MRLEDRKEAAEAALREAEAELVRIRNEEAKRAAMAPDKALAIDLHDTLCRHNHADGCSWHYEFENDEHNWSGWAHARFLKHAQTVIERVGITVAVQIPRAIKGVN